MDIIDIPNANKNVSFDEVFLRKKKKNDNSEVVKIVNGF